MNVELKALIGKLNHETRGAVEAAAGLCLSRTHYDVEIEHFLVKLLDASDNDAAFILKHYGLDRSRLAKELTDSLDSLKTGNARTPALSPSLTNMLTEAWLIGSVNYGAGEIRSGHAIVALATNDDLSRLMRDTSKEFKKIPGDALKADLEAIVARSSEEAGAAAAAATPTAPGKRAGGKTPNLDQFTVNLTQRARDGQLDPVLGREFEIRQIVDILTRRRQNNPILVGEAGVGKSAVAEGFAMRIADGDVPPPLKNVEIHTLDLALLQAGAGIKGEFENRLKGLIKEVKSSEKPMILFIDEAHTMIGAGGTAGQGDAANLLKPALARGELRTIAATTWSEYKKYFEKDPALARRFQLVKVEEPIESTCSLMLRGVVPALEKHHNVRIMDDGVEAAVRLSHRYLPDRQLPDKAVSVLDTACARLALGQSATPAAVEDATRELDDLIVQARVLERESALGIDHSERLSKIAEERAETEQRLEELTKRWEEERDLVGKIKDIHNQLEAIVGTGKASKDGDKLRAELDGLRKKLEKVQGETPLVPVSVDAVLVGEVVSGWTGIPVGKMMRDEVETALKLEELLGERIIGQTHALEALSHRIRTSKANIEDPNKPIGVFMFVGPSGVGKTETALVLSDLLYGGDRNLITINMSEFQEAHTVSTLKGAPPGYVGYGEGGVLTEAVRRRPYSVVLLDEVEKAHPDVLELFFQVFDKGRMEDGEGRRIDFKNTIILLTTNAGTDTIMKLTADPETMPSSEGLAKALKPELDKTFKPAFLGRMVIIPFFPVRDEALKQIIHLKVGSVQRRLDETHGIRLTLDDAVIDAVAERCTEVESGARNIDNILTNSMLPAISQVLLESIAGGTKPSTITVGLDKDGAFEYTTDEAKGSKRRVSAPATAMAEA